MRILRSYSTMSEAGLLLSEPGSDVGDLPLLPEPRRQGRRGDDGGSDQEDAYRDRLREASRNFVSAREARSSLIRAVQSCLEITSAISDLTGSKSRLLSESKRNTLMERFTSISGSPSSERLTRSIQDTSTQLSEMMRKCKELHTIATYVERTVVDPESAMLSELMSTYASMTVLYLWTLSGLHVCTQPLEIFERSTEIAANGLRTLQSQLCQLRRTPSACLTVMKPTLHSHLVSNVTSGSGDLRPQARPSGLRRTSSVFGTTGWPEPCILRQLRRRTNHRL